MPSKIALHVIQSSTETDNLIRSASWAAVKSLGNTSPLVTARDHGVPIRILRQYGVESLNPTQAANQFLACAHLDAANWLQIVCEDTKGYDPDWQLQVINGIRLGGYQGNFLVGGFSTGNPPKITGDPPHFPELEKLYPLLRQPGVALAADCYTGLLVMDPRWAAWAPYTVYRPTLIRADLARQGIAVNVIVTESGGDDIAPVTTGGGWQTRDWSGDEYLTTLKAVDADDRAHPWLLARCLFTSGPTPDWWAFDIAPIAAQLATYVGSRANTPIQTIENGASGPPAPPIAVVTRIGHSMPAPLFQFTQDAGSSDCWVECIRSFFLRYGYPLPLDTVFQAGKGHARPDGGEAATFAEVKHAVAVLAEQLGVTVQEADFDDPNTVAAALHDPNTANPWTVIAGVKEGDLQPGQTYGHFIILDHEDSAGNVQVVDSYTNVDGNQGGRYPFAQLATAMVDNWEPLIDAIGVKITGRAA